ncbi:hypothetical protein EMIT0111MI5_10614 [Burkholderia sp. IT-111MI5]
MLHRDGAAGRAGMPGAAQKGGYRKARSLQSNCYAGPACAMPGKTIDGEKIDEAIR